MSAPTPDPATKLLPAIIDLSVFNDIRLPKIRRLVHAIVPLLESAEGIARGLPDLKKEEPENTRETIEFFEKSRIGLEKLSSALTLADEAHTRVLSDLGMVKAEIFQENIDRIIAHAGKYVEDIEGKFLPSPEIGKLDVSKSNILLYLARKGQTNMSHLSLYATQHSNSAATGSVKSLVELGLVERMPSPPEDRRTVPVKLTEKGKSVFAEILLTRAIDNLLQKCSECGSQGTAVFHLKP